MFTNYKKINILKFFVHSVSLVRMRGHCGCDRMVVGITTRHIPDLILILYIFMFYIPGESQRYIFGITDLTFRMLALG
jgi:hypothetical protein